MQPGTDLKTFISLKTAYIEASLPKRQFSEGSTLWCNSVDKHRLRRRWSTPRHQNHLCVAFLLIPTLGKSGWTLFLMKIQIASVRTSFYRGFVYKQGRLRHRIFKNIETKRWWCANYIGSDSNGTTWVTVFITWSLLLCLFLQIAWYVLSYLCVFWPKHHSSIHLWGMYAVKHTQRLANHISGRLLLSLQSATPIQTAFWWGGSRQDRK